jgi:hypothetical protein
MEKELAEKAEEARIAKEQAELEARIRNEQYWKEARERKIAEDKELIKRMFADENIIHPSPTAPLLCTLRRR